uniref:Uncharacterized protein n=1 Tax=Arundo donax TaxID=35708 RepID=A0A0A9CVP6_ARUDO
MQLVLLSPQYQNSIHSHPFYTPPVMPSLCFYHEVVFLLATLLPYPLSISSAHPMMAIYLPCISQRYVLTLLF